MAFGSVSGDRFVDAQVLGTVVCLVAVSVVDHLIRLEWSTKSACGNEPVFILPAAVHFALDVARRVLSCAAF